MHGQLIITPIRNTINTRALKNLNFSTHCYENTDNIMTRLFIVQGRIIKAYFNGDLNNVSKWLNSEKSLHFKNKVSLVIESYKIMMDGKNLVSVNKIKYLRIVLDSKMCLEETADFIA